MEAASVKITLAPSAWLPQSLQKDGFFFPGCYLFEPESLVLKNMLLVCLKSLPGERERKKKKQHISCFVLSLFEEIFIWPYSMQALSWGSGCHNLSDESSPGPSGSLHSLDGGWNVALGRGARKQTSSLINKGNNFQ